MVIRWLKASATVKKPIGLDDLSQTEGKYAMCDPMDGTTEAFAKLWRKEEGDEQLYIMEEKLAGDRLHIYRVEM